MDYKTVMRSFFKSKLTLAALNCEWHQAFKCYLLPLLHMMIRAGFDTPRPLRAFFFSFLFFFSPWKKKENKKKEVKRSKRFFLNNSFYFIYLSIYLLIYLFLLINFSYFMILTFCCFSSDIPRPPYSWLKCIDLTKILGDNEWFSHMNKTLQNDISFSLNDTHREKLVL